MAYWTKYLHSSCAGSLLLISTTEATQIVCLSEALDRHTAQAALSDQAAPSVHPQGGSASQLHHRPGPQLQDDSANHLHNGTGAQLQAASAVEQSKASAELPAHGTCEETSVAASVSSAPVTSGPGHIHDAIIFQDPEGTLTAVMLLH